MPCREYIDTLEEPQIKSTESEVIDTYEKGILGTSIDDDVAFLRPNQTISNAGISVYSTEPIIATEVKPINYNKPWRQVIRRRVIDGGDYNESKDK